MGRLQRGLKVRFRTNFPGRPWRDGDVYGWWLLDGTDEDLAAFSPNADIELSMQYHLDREGIAVEDFLKRLVHHVRDVFGPFAAQIRLS